ncbi:MAG: hypothetical protein WD030_05175 [Pirellulales bacterium]
MKTEGDQVVLSVVDISVNEPFDDIVSHVPTPADLPGSLLLERPDEPEKTAIGLINATRSTLLPIYGTLAVTSPDVREMPFLDGKHDWDAARARYDQIAPRMRGLLEDSRR